MKTIGIISDTHLREGSTRALPERVLTAFRGVELILHAGDLVASHVVDTLQELAPVIAVRGNNDFGELRDLPTSLRVEIEQVVIGLVHGDEAAFGRHARPCFGATGNRQTVGNAILHFEHDGDVDCIVFGHSHHPLLMEHEIEECRVFLLNPGSPTDKRYAPHYGCALLRVEGARLEPQLITW